VDAPTEAVETGRPSCPFKLLPQHWTVPFTSNAHVCDDPLDTWLAASDSRTAGKEPGTFDTPMLLVDLCPSLPELPSPQHQTLPLVDRAHAWLFLHDTLAMGSGRDMLLSSNGVVVSDKPVLTLEPRPVLPLPPLPQHLTMPPSSTAHVAPSMAHTSITVAPTGTTSADATGKEDPPTLLVLPYPNAPAAEAPTASGDNLVRRQKWMRVMQTTLTAL